MNQQVAMRISRHQYISQSRIAAAGISLLMVFGTVSLQEREPHLIPLARVIPYFDVHTGQLDEVFIQYGSNNEGWGISDMHDRYVKDTQRKNLEFTHKEMKHAAYLISDFEAKQIVRVMKTFSRTLEGLERDLERQNWGRCLYLDNYLPLFLKGFYYLISAAKRSREVFPVTACVADSLFDLTIDSPKSDKRIKFWQDNPEQVIKLRITIKELIFQMGKWKEKDLNIKKRDMWVDNSLKFALAFDLFIKYYFNIADAKSLKPK